MYELRVITKEVRLFNTENYFGYTVIIPMYCYIFNTTCYPIRNKTKILD